MSQNVIAFLFALGCSAWIYNKFYQTTGGNTKTALISAGLSGAAIFVLFWLILSMILPD